MLTFDSPPLLSLLPERTMRKLVCLGLVLACASNSLFAQSAPASNTASGGSVAATTKSGLLIQRVAPATTQPAAKAGPSSAVQAEASLEYFVAESSKLAADDNKQQLQQMQGTLLQLKAEKKCPRPGSCRVTKTK